MIFSFLLLLLVLLICVGYMFFFKKGKEEQYKNNLAVSVSVFSLLVFLVLFVGEMSGHWDMINQSVSLFVISFRNDSLTSFFIFITSIAGGTIMTLLSLLFVGALFFLRNKKIFPSVIAILCGVLSGMMLKEFLRIARPTFSLISETGFSFPSGHALMSTIFFALVYKDLKNEVSEKKGRFLFGVLCASLVFLVCLSRIYLGVHFFADVLAGFFLGIFWVSFWWALLSSRR